MPIDMLKRFLNRLEKFGLVKMGQESEKEGTTHLLTSRGQEFLDTYWKMRGFLEVLGGSIQ